MVGVLVIVVGVVLTAVGISLGTFKPLPGYDSPIPAWLGWSAALFGGLVILGGLMKSIQEIRLARGARQAGCSVPSPAPRGALAPSLPLLSAALL